METKESREESRNGRAVSDTGRLKKEEKGRTEAEDKEMEPEKGMTPEKGLVPKAGAAGRKGPASETELSSEAEPVSERKQGSEKEPVSALCVQQGGNGSSADILKPEEDSTAALERSFSSCMDMTEEAPDVEIDRAYLPYGNYRNPVKMMINLLYVLSLMSKHYDVYHITGEVYFLGCILPGKKTIITLHDFIYLDRMKKKEGEEDPYREDSKEEKILQWEESNSKESPSREENPNQGEDLACRGNSRRKRNLRRRKHQKYPGREEKDEGLVCEWESGSSKEAKEEAKRGKAEGEETEGEEIKEEAQVEEMEVQEAAKSASDNSPLCAADWQNQGGKRHPESRTGRRKSPIPLSYAASWLFWHCIPLKRCSRIVCVSEPVRRELIRRFPFAKDKAVVIPNTLSAPYEKQWEEAGHWEEAGGKTG